MKKSLSYLLLITTIVMSGIFTSCAEDSQLIGTWTESTDGTTIQFKEGSDFTIDGMISGTYVETTSTITLNIGGEETVWRIVSLTDNQLVVTYQDYDYVWVELTQQWVYQSYTETMTFTK